MKPRTAGLVASLALCLLAVPFAGEAQQPAKVPRIGWLVYGSPSPESGLGLDEALRQGLRDLGYVEGKNFAFEYRYSSLHNLD
jgi:putative ABC transport system substrate-binding protein